MGSQAVNRRPTLTLDPRAWLYSEQWYGRYTQPKPVPDLSEQIDNLKTLLKKPNWAEADAGLTATRKKNNGRRPAWYQMYGGPRNLEQSAAAVQPNRSGQYALLYREWSETMHAVNVARQLGKGAGDQPAVARLRDPCESAYAEMKVVPESVLSSLSTVPTIIAEKYVYGAF